MEIKMKNDAATLAHAIFDAANTIADIASLADYLRVALVGVKLCDPTDRYTRESVCAGLNLISRESERLALTLEPIPEGIKTHSGLTLEGAYQNG